MKERNCVSQGHVTSRSKSKEEKFIVFAMGAAHNYPERSKLTLFSSLQQLPTNPRTSSLSTSSREHRHIQVSSPPVRVGRTVCPET